jgi:hypothetical protein
LDVAAIIARAVLEENQEAAYKALGQALLKGNAYVFKELAERAYGKVAQGVELSGKDGGPMRFAELSDGELQGRVVEFMKKLASTDSVLASQLKEALKGNES